ncbi:hypothetical protein KUA24_120 [Vibrio phage HNL01]|nr:hypothetical protein KUA24_120 [Vibrio phage HNL01]
MKKVLTVLGMVSIITLTGCNANGTTDTDFPDRKSSVKTFEHLSDQNILGNRFQLLRHRVSGNCYASYDGNVRQTFAQVVCSDFGY